MSHYKNDLIKAIKSIEEIYFQRNERDFSYELYHKLRGLKLDIDITAETSKSSYKIPKQLISNSFFKKYFFTTENYDVVNNCYNRTPDLLFHEYDNKNKQLLVCEIKPLNKLNNLIYKDIAKLLYYTKSNLSYKQGVLILFATNQNERKIMQLKDKYESMLMEFPEIEIWLVYPKKVNIIWARGLAINEIY